MNSISKTKKIIAVMLVFAILFTTAIAVYASYGANNAAGEDSAAATEKTASYDKIFEKDSVIDIKVEIADADWKSILDDPLAEEYKSATVTVDGVTVENVGFRTKGNLTLKSVANTDSDRYSFRIKLDKYVDGQNLLGLDELVVNNMYSDPSYMREYLSYEALKSIGAEVPDAVYANVYINGELYGFYLCVEAVDDSFLESSFGNADGNLYKQEQGSTLQYVEGSNYDKSELKVGEDESKTDLKNFIKVLNDMSEGQKGEIESVLDVDSALRYIAANTVLGNYDSYSGNMAQNYYLYGQNGKFTVIPWDYNMSMAGFGVGGEATTIPIDEPVMGVNIENLPLINKLLSVAEYKEKYHAYVTALLSYLENYESRVAELSDIIRPYVEADPTKFYTMEQFEASIKYTEESKNTAVKDANTADTTTSASQNANNMPEEGQPQMPPDMQGGQTDADRPAPPQGGFGDMKGGPNGGMGMMGNATSIINYIRDRVENIKQQLAGELPTTGNTTMNNIRGGNRNNN